MSNDKASGSAARLLIVLGGIAVVFGPVTDWVAVAYCATRR
ncbi:MULTISPECIES: hypothetical protein [Pseudomonas]|nr:MULTISPECIES: hypothetical protein [Pseudomonas]MDY7569434.1 hypothetical protein [Pseudomonas sp. CCC4.1]MEB0142518.1 hypothetical protein [Pseudomonas sp. CCC4.1]WOL26274.1 hypothetical protein Q1A94_14995 [Pseudomonas fragi]